MTEASNNLPISIDYTSRDFYSLREDLINRVKANIPTWSGDNPADFGVALIEAFAYMGDVANYYIDRVANESYLSTSTQRSSIMGYAKSLGYTVDGYRAATTTFTFGNSSASAISIPQGTVVYTDLLVNNEIKRIKFTTDDEVTVPANTALASSTTTVDATQGYSLANATTNGAQIVEDGIYGVLLSATDGKANQQYSVNDSNVVDDSLAVYFWDGSNYVKWTRVTNLAVYGKSDRVYTVSLGADNFLTIEFGDGVSGSIPALSNQVWVAYSLGDGVYGNLSEEKLGTSGAFILYSPGKTTNEMAVLTANITFTNFSPSLGGANPESNASIRAGAQTVAGTVLRAVTLLDYENIALTSTNIGKVKAYAYNYSSVTLFVAPKRDSVLPSGYAFDTSDLYPGYDETNTQISNEMVSLLSSVTETVNLYSQIGVTVTVSPVKYTDISIGYTFTALPGYNSAQVERSVTSFLLSRLGYVNARISETLTSESLLKEIVSVAGVATATITTLSRGGSSVNTIIGQPGEIFVVSSSDITAVNNTATKLTGLTAVWNGSASTPSPVFSADTFSYVYSVSGSATTGFVLTPTISPANVTAGAVITIGGTIVASGTTYTMPLTNGTNATTVTVTDVGGIKTDYRILIIKAP
jgi:hypothetical protein